MTAGIAILVQGMLFLRRRNYEVFLILHIVLAAVFIFGAWIHVNNLYCVWFYYTSAAIWGFDRIIRIIRLYAFGFPQADVYLLPDDTLKVVTPKPEEGKLFQVDMYSFIFKMEIFLAITSFHICCITR